MEQEINYKGYKIKIVQDEDPMNPRTDWEPLGTMTCFHRRYNLGDEHDFSNPEDLWQEIKSNHILLPLYLYDHSGITMSTGSFGDPWDSGQVGYIYISLEKVRKEYGWKHITKRRREKVLEYLRAEVGVYDDFLTGNVYGFRVEDGEGEEVESCYGFFGEPESKGGCIDEAKSAIDYLVKKDQEEYEKQPKKKAAEFYTL